MYTYFLFSFLQVGVSWDMNNYFTYSSKRKSLRNTALSNTVLTIHAGDINESWN
jgi:hypothetical protein